MVQKLSLLVPVYNPQPGWRDNLILSFISLSKQIDTLPELILVNDGSTSGFRPEDKEVLQAKFPTIQILEYKENKGKGYALRQGAFLAKNELLLFTDVDFPYTEQSMVEVYQALQEGNDVAIGRRNKDYYQSIPPFRSALSKSFKWLIKTILRLKMNDTQCGLKGFNAAGKEIFLKTEINRFLFDLEFVLYCSRNKNLKMKPIDVELRENTTLGKMPIRILLSELKNFVKIVFLRKGK